jgi:hypothetical protein
MFGLLLTMQRADRLADALRAAHQDQLTALEATPNGRIQRVEAGRDRDIAR